MNAIKKPSALRRRIQRLPVESPITDRFSVRWRSLRGEGQREREDPWYDNQRQHWLRWLEQYGGPGAYGRKDSDRSAQFVYRQVVNPKMLVYLAEASGVSKKVIAAGVRAALAKHTSTMAAMSGAFRREVPWEMVEAALLGSG
jgi:hypothetical protein